MITQEDNKMEMKPVKPVWSRAMLKARLNLLFSTLFSAVSKRTRFHRKATIHPTCGATKGSNIARPTNVLNPTILRRLAGS